MATVIEVRMTKPRCDGGDGPTSTRDDGWTDSVALAMASSIATHSTVSKLIWCVDRYTERDHEVAIRLLAGCIESRGYPVGTA
jgi:hypothetical protein